jgi:hypothetical protein
MKKLLLGSAALLVVLLAGAQNKPVADTTHVRPAIQATPVAPKAKPKPYKEVITAKAVTQKGLFTVHKEEDKYYFEIPDSLLGREILAVVRLSKTAGGVGYGGEIMNQKSLVFEKGPDNNIFVRVVTLISKADSTNVISKAVSNSYLNPIGAVFPIAAYGKDSTSCVVDVTDFFKTDNLLTGLSTNAKGAFRLSGQAADRSYIQSLHTFPLNTEIRTVKTFMANPTPPMMLAMEGGSHIPAADAAGVVTLELNTSLLLLPAERMNLRYTEMISKKRRNRFLL